MARWQSEVSKKMAMKDQHNKLKLLKAVRERLGNRVWSFGQSQIR